MSSFSYDWSAHSRPQYPAAERRRRVDAQSGKRANEAEGSTHGDITPLTSTAIPVRLACIKDFFGLSLNNLISYDDRLPRRYNGTDGDANIFTALLGITNPRPTAFAITHLRPYTRTATQEQRLLLTHTAPRVQFRVPQDVSSSSDTLDAGCEDELPDDSVERAVSEILRDFEAFLGARTPPSPMRARSAETTDADLVPRGRPNAPTVAGPGRPRPRPPPR